MEDKDILLRALPKVDECIDQLRKNSGIKAPPSIIKRSIQEVIESRRQSILRGEVGKELTPDEWSDLFVKRVNEKLSPNFRRVINGTGVVIHTNLGRSLLPDNTTDCLGVAAGYYSNLEFNLQTGLRGSRYSLVENIICELTGAEAALVVNNNAAAVLIALDTLAKGREVIVSRGQLVEIGGSFRIPDVMSKSGATLREVGATNRTHLYDYENNINDNTALLLKVHTSNFKILGFTSDVSAEELVALAKKHGLFTMEDLGSGCLIDFSEYGFPEEPTVQAIVKAGVDVVTFSGDKLLGGPQAGIIAGSREVVEKIKRNPLNRALRIDKFTLASLESILREYYDARVAVARIPTLAMLTAPQEDLKKRARKLLRRFSRHLKDSCRVRLVPTSSKVGGGAFPGFDIPSWAIDLCPNNMNAAFFERCLRELDVPVIGRIENESFLIDLRTIQDREIPELAAILNNFIILWSDR